MVYPDDDKKPDVGFGLNRRAQVTLDRVWPIDKSTRLPITDPMRIAGMDYESKLLRASAKHGTKFIEYRPQTGSWVFKVGNTDLHVGHTDVTHHRRAEKNEKLLTAIYLYFSIFARIALGITAQNP